MIPSLDLNICGMSCKDSCHIKESQCPLANCQMALTLVIFQILLTTLSNSIIWGEIHFADQDESGWLTALHQRAIQF